VSGLDPCNRIGEFLQSPLLGGLQLLEVGLVGVRFHVDRVVLLLELVEVLGEFVHFVSGAFVGLAHVYEFASEVVEASVLD